MTEADYLLAQDLTRVRVAYETLREVQSIDAERYRALMRMLDEERQELFRRVDGAMGGVSDD